MVNCCISSVIFSQALITIETTFVTFARLARHRQAAGEPRGLPGDVHGFPHIWGYPSCHQVVSIHHLVIHDLDDWGRPLF